VVFAGPTFLFLFLPLFIAGYYLLPSRARSPWILLGSWLFYGWWRFDFLALLVGSSLGAGVIGRAIDGASSTRRARALLGLGVAASLGALAYFKYFNFGVESLAGVLNRGESMLIDPDRYWEVVLPVGISFYTFQIISYMVDVYRGTARRADRVVDVAAYVSLFPQLVAGPIVRYSQIADQLTGRVHRWEGFSRGARRFALGLARKVLIADAVAPIADAAFSVADPGTTGAWIGLAAYSVQIYFDFAAYSDMAIGLGLMMGFRFPENFFQPYLSRSITEFWRRWHVTLSQWLRDYLYIPLGGNQRGRTRTLLNLMTVMVLGGLWHGAAWTFVAWGAWHGLWLIVERLLTERVRDAGPGAGRRVERVTRPWSPIELARRIYTLAVPRRSAAAWISSDRSSAHPTPRSRLKRRGD
jgi:alginate O-acetyltransferase complex protein AlgI